jgi:hypothetical protein
MAKTVWYAFQTAKTTRFTAETTMSRIDTVVAVYEAPLSNVSFDKLRLLDCNDDVDFLIRQSEVSWTARPGFGYYLQLGAAKGSPGGDANLRVDPSAGYTTEGKGPDPDLPTGATSVVLESGDLRLGVNDTGNLVARDTIPGSTPGGGGEIPSIASRSALGGTTEPDSLNEQAGRSRAGLRSAASVAGDAARAVAATAAPYPDDGVGLQYLPTGHDALSPGYACEGWGLLDEVSGAHGSVGESSGRTGSLAVVDFQVEGTDSATSIVNVGDGMRVRQKVRPALGNPALFELAIEVTNTSEQAQLPIYRRTMDWDIGPTEFNEYVTIAGDVGGTRGDQPKVVLTSDNGFASPDPSDQMPGGRLGTFTDLGPSDHGALVDIALPKLQPGATSTFSIYYGAAANEQDITRELIAAGSAVYSTASPSSPGGLETGAPNTFGFGFRLYESRYVALGDSFQSGEGAPPYEAGTDVADNRCHRSLKAYPQVVYASADVADRLTFSACSGARVDDLYDRDGDPAGAPWNEGAQMDDVGGDVTVVTVGIGGNDVEFADTLVQCIGNNFKKLADGTTPLCHDGADPQVSTLIRRLTEPLPGERLSRLQKVYSDIRARAPRARVLVVGYPRFFSYDSGKGCLSAPIRPSDKQWINQKIWQLDQAIKADAVEMGFEFVDTYDVPSGHELCSNAPNDQQFLNGIVLANKEHSFHPKTYGHGLLADAVLRQLHVGVAGDRTYTLQQGQRVYTTSTVPAGSPSFSVAATWPGSDVDVSLQSPSGVVYSRRTTVPSAVVHEVGPTFEQWTVPAPEAGVWSIRLHGVEVEDEGEPVVLRAAVTTPVNQAPVAAFTASVSGRTVTVDASASRDPDGTVQDYAWDFGNVILPRAEGLLHLPGGGRLPGRPHSDGLRWGNGIRGEEWHCRRGVLWAPGFSTADLEHGSQYRDRWAPRSPSVRPDSGRWQACEPEFCGDERDVRRSGRVHSLGIGPRRKPVPRCDRHAAELRRRHPDGHCSTGRRERALGTVPIRVTRVGLMVSSASCMALVACSATSQGAPDPKCDPGGVRAAALAADEVAQSPPSGWSEPEPRVPVHSTFDHYSTRDCNDEILFLIWRAPTSDDTSARAQFNEHLKAHGWVLTVRQPESREPWATKVLQVPGGELSAELDVTQDGPGSDYHVGLSLPPAAG